MLVDVVTVSLTVAFGAVVVYVGVGVALLPLWGAGAALQIGRYGASPRGGGCCHGPRWTPAATSSSD